MKKIRLTLKPECDPWSFVLYDSPEAAYYMSGFAMESSDDFAFSISLAQGDFIEVEWTGMEYVADSDPEDGESMMVERVRLAKSYDTTLGGIKASGYVESYVGWVIKGTIPWNRRSHKVVKITRIGDKNEPRLDFSRIFKDSLDEKKTDKLVLN
jgi:hypothetical protein